MKILLILFTSLFFISCSNMTISFEEDSPLYNGPLIDTREDVKSEEKAQIQEQKEVVTQELITQESKETSPKEDETTFSYERDDE